MDISIRMCWGPQRYLQGQPMRRPGSKSHVLQCREQLLHSGYTVLYFVMHQGSERTVVYVAMDAVAGARRTPGRLETGGVPQKPPATHLLSVPSNVLGLRFIAPRRRGVLEAVCRGNGTQHLALRPLGVMIGLSAAGCSGSVFPIVRPLGSLKSM